MLRRQGRFSGAWALTARLLGPKQILRMAAAGLERGSVYLRATNLAFIDKSAAFDLNEGRLADFVGGAVQATLRELGAKNAQVEVVVHTDASSQLTVTW